MIQILEIFAQLQKRENCSESEASGTAGQQCLSILPEVSANEAQLKAGLTLVFGVFAAVAVIVIIIGAINLAAAEGNPEGISKAKKAVIYALIGLIISLSAEIIVLTVLGKI